MEILEAYCEDLGRVVEIYEAQEAYFAQPEGTRKRFRFRCSDPACRATINPLVVGANYHRDAEESEKFQQPHFKSHDKHPHIGTCIWVLGEVRRREQSHDDGDVAEDPNTRRARSKATNVVDVFEPRQSDALLSTAPATVRQPTTDVDDAALLHEGRPRDRTGTTTTSSLEKLIDCWSQMAPEERRNQHIRVGGQTLNYQQLCLRVTQLRESENGSRVVYGGARVKAWPATAPTHYFVNFMDDCDHFADAAGEKSLTISLSIKRLAQTRRGALLIHRVEQAMRPKHYLQVYAWGEIVERGRGKGYELKLAALDNLVLKAIESKGNRPQSRATPSALKATPDGTAQHVGAPFAPAPLPAQPAPMPLDPVMLPPLRRIDRATHPQAPVTPAPPVRTDHRAPAHKPSRPAPSCGRQAQPDVATPLTIPAVTSPLRTHPPAAAPSPANPPSAKHPAVPSGDAHRGLWHRLSAWWRARS